MVFQRAILFAFGSAAVLAVVVTGETVLVPEMIQQLVPCSENIVCNHEASCVKGVADFAKTIRVPLSDDLANTTFLAVSHIDNQHCSCPIGWTGVTCEVKYELACDQQHLCFHGGQCILGLQDRYGNDQLFCDCDRAVDIDGKKYVGKHCEQKEEPSTCSDDSTNFCIHGACNPFYPSSGPPCVCDEGYDGEFCEYAQDTVPTCDLDCINGGVCKLGEEVEGKGAPLAFKKQDYMYCLCPPGVENCERPSDPQACGDGHCLNGGVCLTNTLASGETVNQCDCRHTQNGNTLFAGRFCQYAATSFCSVTGTFDSNFFCVNNGECNTTDPYKGCACQEHYRGFHCQFYVQNPADITDANKPVVSDTGNSDTPANPVSDLPEQVACDLDCGEHGVCNIGVKDNSNLGYAAFAPHLSETTTEDFRHCVCSEGWVGLFCDQEIQVCDGNVGISFCLHGAQCKRAGPLQPTTCDCATATSSLGDSFIGDHCEHFSTDVCSIAQGGPAKPIAFCTNGGTCKKRGIAPDQPHPGCDCTADWKGSHCEVRARQELTTPTVPETTPHPPGPPRVPSAPKKDPIAATSTKTQSNDDDGKPANLGIILGVILVGLPLLVGFVLFVRQCERRFVANASYGTTEDQSSLFRPLGFRRKEHKHSSARDPMTSFSIKAMMKPDENDEDRSKLMNQNISPPTREEEQLELTSDEEAGFLT